ncbi:MAG: hypothetical protein HND48_19810 [Chloroflexi bacterium]|nr:hypothetical protein [Chloroflexota bacterium]
MSRSKVAVFLLSCFLVLLMNSQAFLQDDVIEIEYWQYNFAGRIEAMDDLIAQFEAEPGYQSHPQQRYRLR